MALSKGQEVFTL